jgi:crotonobetainyl-CoA:carnitine CoA-transferase CaiB-like acyl-CoA transferase
MVRGEVAMSGLRDKLVVEVGHGTAVGAAGRLLADLGAAVVVIEAESPEIPGSHATQLAGKRSLVDCAENAPLIQELLVCADVLLTSSDTCHRSRGIVERSASDTQRHVTCDITAFGSEGPLAGRSASDALLQGWSGVASVTGRPDGPPLVSTIPALEIEAGVYAAAAVCAALSSRLATGDGQLVEIAVFDVAVNALAAFLPLPLSGLTAHRNGNRHATLSPWNTYPTTDGWIMLCAPTDDQWRRLCSLLDRADLVTDPACMTSTARMLNADTVDEHVARWTVTRARDECEALLREAGLPCGPIVSLEMLPDEANVKHRGMIWPETDPVTDRSVMVPGNPVGYPRGPHTVPRVGEGVAWVRKHIDELRTSPCARQDPSLLPDAHPGRPPLQGVRVVEIGMNTVAPLAGRQLGALGADVIKVEPPTGDANRSLAPLRDDGQSYMFAISNTDKRGVVLDLKTDEDRKTLWDLLKSADVLIENLKPGSLSRLGFGADAVRERFPRLIYCSMNGFGHDSAYPGRPALDTVVQAMGGVMEANAQDGRPTKLGISLADQLGGLMGLTAAIGALIDRADSEVGRTIDIAMHDAVVWATHPVWNGANTASAVLLACSDGHVVIDRAGLGDIDRTLLTEAARMTRADLMASLEPGPFGRNVAPVLSVDEVLDHPHTKARGVLLQRGTPDGSTWTVLQTPMRLNATPARVRYAMPALGWPDPLRSAEPLATGAALDRPKAHLMGGHHA